MSLTNASHKEQLRAAGWYSRGYLPHFDGRAIPQFITLHLADSIPKKVIRLWEEEDGVRYDLFSWVVMPNHSHFLLTRFEDWELEQLMHSHKSYTAHQANKLLNRTGKFWMEEYFDRYIRNADHFRNAVNYIENNPVKAGLCSKPSDWPFSSAWFREHGKK
jgi:REP element-mobilizing transposase RayT